MRIPKMILFDYGQTIGNETPFNNLAGDTALLAHALTNPHSLGAEEVAAKAWELMSEVYGFNRNVQRHEREYEILNCMILKYLYASLSIRLDLTDQEIDRLYWDAAAPAVPTDGINELLSWLMAHGIRIGVISNIMYAAPVVEERIHRLVPEADFEFIIATSDYLFRKPSPRIFELGLIRAREKTPEIQADEIWYCGDTYAADVVGARSVGMVPVWYQGAVQKYGIQAAKSEKPAAAPAEDVLTIHHWDELRKILESLF